MWKCNSVWSELGVKHANNPPIEFHQIELNCTTLESGMRNDRHKKVGKTFETVKGESETIQRQRFKSSHFQWGTHKTKNPTMVN